MLAAAAAPKAMINSRRIAPASGSGEPMPAIWHRSVPDDLRHFRCRRGVAAALGADDAVDDGHADAGQVAELNAVEDVLACRMLRPVHDDKIGRAADFDDAAVQRAHPRGVAGGEAERDFRRDFAERGQ